MADTMPVAKKEREVELVTMTDGRKVEFVGKRRVLKETLLDESTVAAMVWTCTIAPMAGSLR